MEPRKAVLGLAAAAVGAIEGAVLISQKLLIYSDAVKIPLVGGGVFGLFVGSIVGLLMPTKAKPVVAMGVAGCLSLYFFYDIVSGERDFGGRGIVLFLLSFAVSTTLLYLTTKFTVLLGPLFEKVVPTVPHGKP